MDEFQEKFIYNEIWTLTFSAAFQRASVYNENISDIDKNEFKKQTKLYIETELLPQYQNRISLTDEQHVNNIQKISDYTLEFENLLLKGKLNFGVSQKLLNLVLKYLWCIFEYPEPPHFPVDRRIQETISFKPIISWTKIDDLKEYMKIIDFVKERANGNSIAQFEIEHFERRRNQILPEL